MDIATGSLNNMNKRMPLMLHRARVLAGTKRVPLVQTKMWCCFFTHASELRLTTINYKAVDELAACTSPWSRSFFKSSRVLRRRSLGSGSECCAAISHTVANMSVIGHPRVCTRNQAHGHSMSICHGTAATGSEPMFISKSNQASLASLLWICMAASKSIG